MSQMMVFVSHAHEDNAFCQAIVDGLRGAGADVWYDQHNLGSGQLMTVIQRELGRRPVVVVILSKAAFASTWVHREVTWAYELLDLDPTRFILPVTAGPIERGDFDPARGWFFLHGLMRVEAPGMQPYPAQEAVRRLLRALALTSDDAQSAPRPLPQIPASAPHLLTRARALVVQRRYAEALPLLQHATQLDPRSFDAWVNLGYAYQETGQHALSLDAYDHALALDGKQAHVWYNKGKALYALKRYQEALTAYERATTLGPTYARTWSGKGIALAKLNRLEEALAAFEQATARDPSNPKYWTNKAMALSDLHRADEALAAFDRALALDPTLAPAWSGKGLAFHRLHRHEEALAVFDRALALDPTFAEAWNNKGMVLGELKQFNAALAAFEQATSLDPALVIAWKNKAVALRRLGRIAEAEASERRAE